MVRTAILATFLGLAGCPASVIAQYEEARESALADPGPLPADWRPDAVLHLSPELVDGVVSAALAEHGTIDREVTLALPIGSADLAPDLEVARLELAGSRACASCLAVSTRLEGDVGWRLGRSAGRLPLRVDADVDMEILAASEGGTWTVTLRPQDVRRLDLRFEGAAAGLGPLLQGDFKDFVRKELGERVAPIEVARFGAEGLPLRAVKLAPADRGITISMRTTSPTPDALASSRAKLASGWQLDLSQGSLLDLARRTGFQHGPVARGVVVEPTSLELGAETFTMGIRLWKTVGRGWWRDYTVQGTIALVGDEVELKAAEVLEGDKSPGATLADPLAAIAEGFILETLERSIAATLPTSQDQAAGGVATRVRVRSLAGGGEVFTVRGDLEVGPARARGKPSRPR